jgi:predicted nucleotidyltransferase component of viral defense system
MIQVDTASHNFKYAPGRKLLNKFDVFTQISVTPLDILLSQKIYALLSRKRTKGRDLYDIVFLLSLTIPNYNYLEKKINISNSSDLRNKLLEEIKNMDLKELSRDVEAFLFSPKDSKKIILFEEFLKQAKLD